MRVREPVSTVLEMTEIQTRLIAESGPAVIFEKPGQEPTARAPTFRCWSICSAR